MFSGSGLGAGSVAASGLGAGRRSGSVFGAGLGAGFGPCDRDGGFTSAGACGSHGKSLAAGFAPEPLPSRAGFGCAFDDCSLGSAGFGFCASGWPGCLSTGILCDAVSSSFAASRARSSSVRARGGPSCLGFSAFGAAFAGGACSGFRGASPACCSGFRGASAACCSGLSADFASLCCCVSLGRRRRRPPRLRRLRELRFASPLVSSGFSAGVDAFGASFF